MKTIQMTYMCWHTFEITTQKVQLCTPSGTAYFSDSVCPYCQDFERGPVENDTIIRIHSHLIVEADHYFLSPDEPFSSTGGMAN